MADDTVTVQIEGLDRLEEKLVNIGPRLARRVMRKAGLKGAQIFQTAIEEKAPVLTGNLEGHIGVTTKINKTDGITIAVGPEKDAGYFKGAERHGQKVTFSGSPHYADVAARMEEFGSKHEPARPFIGPAFEENAEEVLNVFVDEVWNALQDLAE